jgi:hypothetical protein
MRWPLISSTDKVFINRPRFPFLVESYNLTVREWQVKIKIAPFLSNHPEKVQGLPWGGVLNECTCKTVDWMKTLESDAPIRVFLCFAEDAIDQLTHVHRFDAHWFEPNPDRSALMMESLKNYVNPVIPLLALNHSVAHFQSEPFHVPV